MNMRRVVPPDFEVSSESGSSPRHTSDSEEDEDVAQRRPSRAHRDEDERRVFVFNRRQRHGREDRCDHAGLEDEGLGSRGWAAGGREERQSTNSGFREMMRRHEDIMILRAARQILEEHRDVGRFLESESDQQDGPFDVRDVLVRGQDEDGDTLLWTAACAGNLASVISLVKAGADVNHVNKKGVSVLLASVLRGVGRDSEVIFRHLLQRGARVDQAEQRTGRTSLIWTVQMRRLDAVVLFVGAGADVTRADRHGFQPIHFACKRVPWDEGPDENDEEEIKHVIVHCLLAGGEVDVNASARVAGRMVTSLSLAVRARDLELVKLLVERHGADPSLGGHDSALVTAITTHNIPIAEYLASQPGVDLNKSRRGFSPFATAMSLGNTEMIKALIKLGADPLASAVKGKKTTPLDVAKWHRKNELRDLVWTETVQPGFLEFCEACERGDLQKVMAMAGSSIAVELSGAYLAGLGHAWEADQTEVVDRLLAEHEARHKAKGGTLHAAIAADEAGLVALLLQRGGMDVEAKDPGTGMTPALVAASRGSVRALEVLVEVGHADLRARDKKGRTVVALAKLGNHHNVLDLLRTLDSQGKRGAPPKITADPSLNAAPQVDEAALESSMIEALVKEEEEEAKKKKQQQPAGKKKKKKKEKKKKGGKKQKAVKPRGQLVGPKAQQGEEVEEGSSEEEEDEDDEEEERDEARKKETLEGEERGRLAAEEVATKEEEMVEEEAVPSLEDEGPLSARLVVQRYEKAEEGPEHYHGGAGLNDSTDESEEEEEEEEEDEEGPREGGGKVEATTVPQQQQQVVVDLEKVQEGLALLRGSRATTGEKGARAVRELQRLTSEEDDDHVPPTVPPPSPSSRASDPAASFFQTLAAAAAASPTHDTGRRLRPPLSSNLDGPDPSLCPISFQTLADPVLASDGNTYERAAILDWFRMCLQRGWTITSPLTGVCMASTELRPNRHALDTLQQQAEGR